MISTEKCLANIDAVFDLDRMISKSFQPKNFLVGKAVFSHAALFSLFKTVMGETALFIKSAY